MKKIISFLLISLFLIQAVAFSPVADTGAEIAADNVKIEISGSYAIDEIKDSLNKLKDGDISTDELHEKYKDQLIAVDVYCSGIDNINKLYGLQFMVTTDNEDIAIASLSTNIQNGNKIGTSLWSAYINAQDTQFQKARVLLYGTKEVNSELNKTVNLIEEDKYKVATIYLVADKDFKGDATVTLTVEDIASKNNKGTVVSAKDSFKPFTSFTITEGEPKEIKMQMLGAQVRTSLPQGLRFGTEVDFGKDKKDITDVSYGTLIAVTNQLDGEELTIGSDKVHYNCSGRVYSEKGNKVVFTGEITGFSKDGKYDTVNFTARSYIRYKQKGSAKYTVVYAEPIVRNVDNIKSKLGMK